MKMSESNTVFYGIGTIMLGGAVGTITTVQIGLIVIVIGILMILFALIAK